ncbi:MAG: hypothetical protein A2431_03140 [Candidatus Zambryskibacteria bacterium RIFOXYC1_FULL_39_10]|uniref:Uncharacterized protein n=1 Tax=Candidatus Zambryskibacteria bacterium RIFOXYC1_FULL_39_10 TaxID=1802779 RepID=A0A1G2V056_9BACT|nr:MAG: hypothetical protein A2605_01930 [Candidatus Zambryskibacteria bacterium RIFOXYD1_FULL_39_35]OHB15015.1 MAG: hypothetical protein A2431_03140 [Candidatus Zambryskibacteria bacterium RIFOXYC1_FULL_39_10]
MNNWIPKNKILRFAVGLAALGLVLYLAGVMIISVKTKKVERSYSNTESDLFKEQKFWAIKSVVDTNEESIKYLKDFFVKSGDEVFFIEKIEEMARISNTKLEIVSIDIKPNQADLFGEEVLVKIKVSGTWDSVMLFVDKLERMNFGVVIDDVNLDAEAQGNWVGAIEFIFMKNK